MQQVIFEIAGNEYGLDIRYINGIETVSQVTPVPNSPVNVLGILNLRGNVLPVYSLRARFNLPEVNDTNETKLIVTKCANTEVAFKADKVIGIENFAEKEILETPKVLINSQTRFFTNVLNRNGKLIMLIDQDVIFDPKEAEILENLRQQD
ncbi:MAG: chemotaxis protein CheW [Lachnospiraceae bacterium]|nr:chemotaxis protein CheW [Lachnospiraceae bacterium]